MFSQETLSDALQYACEYGYVEVAKELLNLGSQISTAIELCFQYDLSIEIMELLLTPLKDKVMDSFLLHCNFII